MPRAVRALRARPLLVAGGAIIALYLVVAVLAPVLSPWDPHVANAAALYRPPGGAHPFGTDRFGMDVFSRVLHAARLDLGIATASVGLAFVAGTALGALGGYAGGPLDWALMRLMEVVQSFPTLILAIAVLAAAGQSVAGVVLVIAAVGVPYYVRLVRGEVRALRASALAEAARSTGAGDLRVVLRHLLPNSLGPAVAYAAVNAAWAILIAASLGFLGLGVRVPEAEWGLMISLGAQSLLTGQWWVVLFPGIALFGLITAFYLLADGVQDLLDPRSTQ